MPPSTKRSDNYNEVNPKIKLVFISTDLNTGGAEMVLLQLVSMLSQSYNIYVISLSTVGEIGEKIINLGIPVEALNLNASLPNPFKIFKLYRLLKLIEPDIINTWLYHANLLGGIMAKFLKIKSIIWSIHHSDVKSINTRFKTRIIINISSYLSNYIPTNILFCSQKSMNVHKSIGYNKKIFKLIPNGFDISNFHPNIEDYASVRQELGIKKDTLLVGLVARFDPIKNHMGFLESAYNINKTFPNAHFILVGQGVDNMNIILNKWINKFDLANKVHLLGLRHDIPRLTSSFDIAALTSWSEAFPTVVGEAMASAIPCVVTNVGDAAYMVGDTGKVIEPGNMKAFAEACCQLLFLTHEERKSLGIIARQRIIDNFELNSISKKFNQFYLEQFSKDTK